MKALKERIHYIGIAGTSGYAEAAKNYLLALASKHEVKWQPLHYDDSLRQYPDEKDLLTEKYINNKSYYNHLLAHCTADQWQKYIHTSRTPFTKNIVGITVWETNRLHPIWIEACNNADLDEIWVPVQWNKDVFEESGVTKPVKVVPHIYNEPFEHLAVKSIPTISTILGEKAKNKYLFYTIGQWNERKGITDTIHAFCKAFNSKDNVALVVKTFWGRYSNEHKNKCQNELKAILQQYADAPEVILLTHNLSRQELLALHLHCQCYVLLCKSEGWGLGAFEAAAQGNEVVITGYGGQTEFLPQRYPYLVDYTLTPVTGMPWIPWYTADMDWAKPDINDAVDKMRLIFSLGRQTKNQELKKGIRENFSSQHVLSAFSNLISSQINQTA